MKTNAGPVDTAPGPEREATRHLGLDFGATNIKWSVVEASSAGWRVLGQGALATDAVAGPEAVVDRIVATARAAVEAWPGIRTVGIGVPGLYDPATGATRKLINTPGDWDGRPVGPPVEAALGLPAALINDARAFGLAELRLGAGRGAGSMIGLTLGTGVGGVVAIHGQVLLDHDGTAGEIGHQTIDPDGPECGCGNRGCLEAYARAADIAAACGTATAEEAVRAAEAGDQRARAGLRAVGRVLGVGIASTVTILAPDVVVIGGGVAAAGELLLGPIRDEMARRARMTDLARVRVVTAELGTWAGAIGAAIHAAEEAGRAEVPRRDGPRSPGAAA